MSEKLPSDQRSTNSTSSTPSSRSATVTTGVRTTQVTTSAATSPSSKAEGSIAARDLPTGGPFTEINVTSPESTLDTELVTTLGPMATAFQPQWPTVWPPPPAAPAVQLNADSYVPWKEHQQALAVRPYATDPLPCPVVKSIYPGLTQ